MEHHSWRHGQTRLAYVGALSRGSWYRMSVVTALYNVVGFMFLYEIDAL